MKLVGVLVVALLAMPLGAHGADKDGRLFVFYPGSQSCGSYLQVREEQEQDGRTEWSYDEYGEEILVFITWLNGFLTAYNHLIPDTYDIGGGKGGVGLMEWLDNYCRAHPRKSFYEAAAAITVQLYPKRLREGPKQ